MPEWHPGSILNDYLLCLMIYVEPERFVLLHPGLFQEAIKLEVGVLRLVVIALAVEQDIQEILRVRVIRDPAKTAEHLEPILMQVLKENGPFCLEKLDPHAQVSLPHRQHGLDGGVDGGAEAAW